MNKVTGLQRIAVLLVAAFSILLLVLWLTNNDTGRSSPIESVVTAVPDKSQSKTSGAHEPNADPASVSDIDVSGEPALDTVARYEELTRYVHGTRKIDQADKDVLNPGARFERRQVVTRNPLSLDAGKELLFTADRFYIVGDQVAEITLELWRDGHSFMSLLPEMRAELLTDGAPAQTVWLKVERGGTGAIALFQPDNHWPGSAGPIKVTAVGTNIGADARGATLDFHFTSSERIPAEFTAVLGDHIDNGNLVVEIALNVQAAGEYLITANIHDRDGIPFGTTQFRSELALGNQIARLTFDGLLFHDAEAQGPYYLTTLRGERVIPESLAVSERIPVIGGTYISEHYELSQFRASPAYNPRRARMLDFYRDAQERGLQLTPPAN